VPPAERFFLRAGWTKVRFLSVGPKSLRDCCRRRADAIAGALARGATAGPNRAHATKELAVKQLTILICYLALLLAGAASTAKADYAYGSFGQYSPYYDRARPWWGGITGWGPYHGYSGYPAYRCAPTSRYRLRPCLYPPSSYYYGYPDYHGGYTQYPREFLYDWSPDAGDQAPNDANPARPQMDPERQ
jgi:hypothetical protein